jgi:hypothetical protein
MTMRQRWLREAGTHSVARLAADLAEDGYSVEVDAERGELVISGEAEERFDPPVRLTETDESLRRSLLALADSAAELWPDVSPVEAAYRLVLVTIDEEVAVAIAPPPSSLRPLPPGEYYEYLSPEQYRERYGDKT